MSDLNPQTSRAGSGGAESAEGQPDFQAGKVAAISAGHAVHDTYTAFLPPILPELISKFSLLKTEAGLLAVLLQVPSLIQPVIGHLSDRFNLRWIVILAPAVAAVLMSLLGIAPTYGLLMLLLLLAGINSAAFHATAPVVAGRYAGSRLGKGMGFWMVGGELGRTLGPVIVVSGIGLLTLRGMPWLMIGGLLASAILFLKLKDVSVRILEHSETLHWKQALRHMRPVMLPLAGVIAVRAFLASALTTYLPTFLTEEGSSLWLAGVSLTVLEAAGVAGAFLGGSLSDRLGRRLVLFLAQLVAALVMLIFLASGGWVRLLFLIVLGFSLLSITPVIMALVQESFPANRALANGVYMAMSFVIRAAAILIMGFVGDVLSLRVAFYGSAGLMLLGLPLLFLLPAGENQPDSR